MTKVLVRILQELVTDVVTLVTNLLNVSFCQPSVEDWQDWSLEKGV